MWHIVSLNSLTIGGSSWSNIMVLRLSIAVHGIENSFMDRQMIFAFNQK
jgi:hypothetical protein